MNEVVALYLLRCTSRTFKVVAYILRLADEEFLPGSQESFLTKCR
jgi:hypothetical protein